MNALTALDLRHATSVRRTSIHVYVDRHWLALRNAALLLGGQRAAHEADRLFEDLAAYATIGVHTQRRLDRMLRRLELDDDIVSDDVLNLIDPSDPVVEDICLLADGLRDAADWLPPVPHTT